MASQDHIGKLLAQQEEETKKLRASMNWKAMAQRLSDHFNRMFPIAVYNVDFREEADELHGRLCFSDPQYLELLLLEPGITQWESDRLHDFLNKVTREKHMPEFDHESDVVHKLRNTGENTAASTILDLIGRVIGEVTCEAGINVERQAQEFADQLHRSRKAIGLADCRCQLDVHIHDETFQCNRYVNSSLNNPQWLQIKDLFDLDDLSDVWRRGQLNK